MKVSLGSLASLATIAAELAFLYWLWRELDENAPSLDELAARAWAEARERAQYAEAIRQTLSSIRGLPETEGPE